MSSDLTASSETVGLALRPRPTQVGECSALQLYTLQLRRHAKEVLALVTDGSAPVSRGLRLPMRTSSSTQRIRHASNHHEDKYVMSECRGPVVGMSLRVWSFEFEPSGCHQIGKLYCNLEFCNGPFP